jgi:hypothetical protein
LVLVYKGFLKEVGLMCERAVIEFALTPYRAYVACDAIIRTLYRLMVSKQNLLRWNTAESVDASIINTLKGYFLTMWISIVVAIGLIISVVFSELSIFNYVIFAVVILLWAFAYYIAYQISQPKDAKSARENMQINGSVENSREREDKELLLETARKTWQFFKDFSTKENNYLCPDNYQISRVEKVSEKTSPTNIGLQFLSILSARDFGYETLSSTVSMIENLLNTVKKLEKWKGHLYNWYHIKTLDILQPAYISTVDSGNFLGHLITLKQGLKEQINTPIFNDYLLKELIQTVNRSIQNCKHVTTKSQYVVKDKYETIGDLIEDITDIWDDLNNRDIKHHTSPCWCKELANIIETIVEEVAGFKLKDKKIGDCPSLKQLANENNKVALKMIERIDEICNKIDNLAESVDFHFLFNEKRNLFHIGYHTSSHMLDTGCYD